MASNKKKDIETPGQMIRYLREKEGLSRAALIDRYHRVMEQKGGNYSRRSAAWLERVEQDPSSKRLRAEDLETLIDVLNASTLEKIKLYLEPDRTLSIKIDTYISTEQSKDIIQPPKRVTELLEKLLPQKEQPDIFGDLQEEFEERCARFGYKKATWWYRWQALTTLWFFLWRIGKNAIQRIK